MRTGKRGGCLELHRRRDCLTFSTGLVTLSPMILVRLDKPIGPREEEEEGIRHVVRQTCAAWCNTQNLNGRNGQDESTRPGLKLVADQDVMINCGITWARVWRVCVPASRASETSTSSPISPKSPPVGFLHSWSKYKPRRGPAWSDGRMRGRIGQSFLTSPPPLPFSDTL